MFHRYQERHQRPLVPLVEWVAPLQQDSFHLTDLLPQSDPALQESAVPRQDPAPAKAVVLHQGRFLTREALLRGHNSLLIMLIPLQGRFLLRAALVHRGTTPHMVILLQSDTSQLKVALTRFHPPDHSTYRIAAHCPIMGKMHPKPVYHVYDVESLIWGSLCEECRGAQFWWAWLL